MFPTTSTERNRWNTIGSAARPTLILILALTSMGCLHDAPRPKPKPVFRVVPQGPKPKPPFQRVFLRAFKREGELELWAGGDPLILIRTYPIAAMSGTLGPKRREGDLQVPEGFYRIARFNPHSRFHLSMGLNYPNQSDRLRGDAQRPGTDIYIHGNRVSAGCMAMTDPLIEEIYRLCNTAGNRRTIPVHVFPARLDDSALEALCKGVPQHAAFWRELKPMYDAFERTHVVPRVSITKTGAYRIADGRSRL